MYVLISIGWPPQDQEDFLQRTYDMYATEGLRYRLVLRSTNAGIGGISA